MKRFLTLFALLFVVGLPCNAYAYVNYDPDLNPVLHNASDEDLQPLVEYITGKLSNYIEIDENYKRDPYKPTAYANTIASEIRSMGGNTFANLVRGGGVEYREIVCDVADKLKVNYNKNASVERIEGYIIQKLFADVLESLPSKEREQLLNDIAPGVPLKKQAAAAAAIAAFNAGGFVSYKIALIVANSVAKIILGHGLSLAANATLTQTLGILSGPVGWAAVGAWTLINVAGPSYKVTIPCVVHIAMLRQKQKYEDYAD
ncbi:MAG: ubiquinol-cytochrome C chaperone family protein [Synergistes sp.]|nr:ubiquinol-cytochrome C chaperone family protein [Synergistes sp.]